MLRLVSDTAVRSLKDGSEHGGVCGDSRSPALESRSVLEEHRGLARLLAIRVWEVKLVDV